jgi:hypothetical protein
MPPVFTGINLYKMVNSLKKIIQLTRYRTSVSSKELVDLGLFILISFFIIIYKLNKARYF